MEFLYPLIVSLVGILGAIVGFFAKGWKKSVDDSLSKMQNTIEEAERREAKCKLSVATEFQRTKDCKITHDKIESVQAGLFKRMQDLSDKISNNHTQIMYQMGVKDGRDNKGDKE